MGGKGKWALLVSIQERIKTPLSRAYSKCFFYLFRVYWPPTAVFSNSSFMYKEVISDPARERQLFAF